MVKFIKGMLYTCECGYETTNTNLASKHCRTIKCKSKIMEKKNVEFVLKEDYLAMDVKDVMAKKDVSKTDDIFAELRAEIDELSATVKRQRNAMIKLADDKQFDDDDDDDCEGSGIIYFVRDTVVTDRGKIGRTKNTDVKKLKSRYSTFGSPRIQCYFSTDIKTDEAKLKARLREVGCMQSNTEMVTNCDIAISVFCEFASG